VGCERSWLTALFLADLVSSYVIGRNGQLVVLCILIYQMHEVGGAARVVCSFSALRLFLRRTGSTYVTRDCDGVSP
jgi:hypothetical protein